MILLRDNHARRLIEKAHKIWKKIERTEVAYLFTDDEEMTKLLEEHGKKSNDELETAWLIELSNHKLRQMMLEATHEMGRERTVSWRFEKHIILGDVIKGWNEYDSKGRPVLHVNTSLTGTGGHVQPYYVTTFSTTNALHARTIMCMNIYQRT